MALHEFQTAAAHVVFTERATDQAVDELRERFGYHPLDLEEIFRVPKASGMSAYGAYALLTLIWPSTERVGWRDLRFFVDRRRLVVIGELDHHLIAQELQQFNSPASASDHLLTPTAILHALLQTITADAREQEFRQPGVAPLFTQAAIAIRQLGRWLQSQDERTVVPSLIVDAYQLDVLADRRPIAPTTPHAVRDVTTTTRLPRLMRTYAYTSAAMVLLVLITLAIR